MPIQGTELIARVRRDYAEPSANRWTDADILSHASDEQIELLQIVKCIENSVEYSMTGGVGTQQLPDLVKILRVYVIIANQSQQRMVPSDIDTMEGTQIEYFDNTSGTYGIGTLQMSPQWIAEQSQAYPILNAPMGGSTPNAPYESVTLGSQRPVYYRRGGVLGVAPIPSAAYTLHVDYVPVPPDLNSDANYFVLPSNFRDALTFGTCERLAIADYGADSPRAGGFGARKIAAIDLQREWLRDLDGDKPRTMTPITARSFTRFEDCT